MEREIWKDIAGYEGYYQVSNMGRVKSVYRIIDRCDGTTQRVSERILKPFNTGSAPHYLGVHLRKDGERETLKIHRLVAKAFIPNPEKLDVVDHIDSDTHNNKAANLRWCTYSDNNRYCIAAGRDNPKHYHDWSSDSQRSYRLKRCKPFVRNDGKRYECLQDAADDLGVKKTSVHRVLKGRSKTCKGYQFTYVQKG